MQALIFSSKVHPHLEVAEIEPPQPQPHRVLVQVNAIAINPYEVQLAQQSGLVAQNRVPFVCGMEAVGAIVALGDGVTGFTIGQRVAIFPSLATTDKTADLHTAPVLGYDEPGVFARFVALPQSCLISLPEAVEDSEAVAVMHNGALAWRSLVSKGGVIGGERVLIEAANTPVGTMAVQIARLWGASTLALVSDPAQVEAIQNLGADIALVVQSPLTAGSITEAVVAFTEGLGFDLVLKPSSNFNLSQAELLVAAGGRIVICKQPHDKELSAIKLLPQETMIATVGMPSRSDYVEVLNLLAQSRLEAVIAEELPLNQRNLESALYRLGAGTAFGKIVFTF